MTIRHKIMTVAEVATEFRISAQTVRKKVKKGEFPAPMTLTRCLRWRRETIEEFFNAQ